MGRRVSTVLASSLSLLLVACGSGEPVASSSSTIQTTSTTVRVVQTTTTSTLPVTTTTAGVSTTESSSGLPGDPIDFGPAEGDIVAVIGVAHDDVLNLRAAPGADQDIVAGIPPLFSDLIAAGETRQLAASIWIKVDYSGLEGWVNLRFVAYLGATNDATADVVANLGETPVAETMPELGLIVAESVASDEPKSNIIMSVEPTTGDLGEVTYDVIGLGDDAVRGLRLHVFGQPGIGGFSLASVEATPLCGRGVDDSGLCVLKGNVSRTGPYDHPIRGAVLSSPHQMRPNMTA